MKPYQKAYLLTLICTLWALACMWMLEDGTGIQVAWAFAAVGAITFGFGLAGQYGPPRVRDWVDSSF